MKICVLGAGIVGANTALELQRQYRNAQITVIADKFNQDTTSDGAAGLFMVVSGSKGYSEEVSERWVTDSFEYYRNAMLTDSLCGVRPISGYCVSNMSEENIESKVMKSLCPDYRKITNTDNEKFNVNFKHGIHLTTFIIPSRKFLPWAFEKFKNSGGKVIQKRINNVDSLAGDYDVLFNCTGLNSRYLFGDTDVLPIRGIVVQVKAPSVTEFCVEDFNTYIIPCAYDNIVTLGGTRDYGCFDTTIDEYYADSVMHRCTKILPKLRTVPVVRKWAGLRPHRDCIRVEMETRNKLKIVHNYGHGGSGVTLSPGTSIHAIKLLGNVHRASGSCKL